MTTKQSGYALIELLIVLSIIILFSALSLAYYQNFNEQEKLYAETKQLIDVFNLASKKSSAGDLSPEPNCSDFEGYSVELMPPNTYALQFNCTGSPPEQIQSYTFGSNLTFSLSEVGTVSVLFKPLSSGTNLNNSLFVTIINGAIQRCETIRINPIGTVEEQPDVCSQ